MSFLIGLLTVLLVLDCALLILLVLIQLPKKEAGAGVAFGGAATDALFGAGTGNVLTKVTKYGTWVFFILLIVVGYMQSKAYHSSSSEFQRSVEQASKGLVPRTAPAAATATAPAATPTTSAATPSSAPASPATTPAEVPAGAPETPTPAPEAPK